MRPSGICTNLDGTTHLRSFGQDERGEWRGYQILRSDLDAVLLSRFRNLGGQVVQPAKQVEPIIRDGTVLGARCTDAVIEAPFTIDASGKAGLLRRSLKLPQHSWSRRLLAHYGYVEGQYASNPSFSADRSGWKWIADVAPGIVHWTRVSFEGRTPPSVPVELAYLPTIGRRRSADATWRRSEHLAGPGYFMAGDAAGSLDPSASNGVLRALMSGMMAASCVADVVWLRQSAASAAQGYERWLSDWFDHDVSRLRTLYAEIGGDRFIPDENPAGTVAFA